MIKRSFLLSCAALLCAALFPAQSSASDVSLDAISAYFNGFKTAQATFTQVNSDGSATKGRFYMRRPGRARFEYTDNDALVMVGGSQVAIFDPVSNTLPEQYPLRRTPLAHVLARKVDLNKPGVVLDFRANSEAASLTLQDPKHPEYGNIELIFELGPIALQRWITTNEFGDQTVVILDELETGVQTPSGLFSIPTEISARGLSE